MIEAFQFEFMQNALLAIVLVSLACGVIGSLVVVNRMVFMAGGVAHSAYGGVGLAFFFALPVMPTVLAFTLAVAFLMAALTRHRPGDADTWIGVIWAAGMAAGILLLDMAEGYNVDLMSYLFGSLLTVPRQNLWLAAGLDGLILTLVALFYKNFLALSFDREFAKSRGIRVEWLHLLLVAMIAVSVVVIVQVVGLILVIALLSIPPYLARLHAPSLLGMMALATGWCLVFSLGGLWLSYQFDLTSGASIIALAAATFLLAQTIRGFGKCAG